MPIQVKMKASRAATLQLPVLGAVGNSTSLIHMASDVPSRVAVRNTGAVDVFLSHSQTALQQVGQTNDAYRLAAGEETIIVLAPGQMLFASGAGINGRISILVSDAIPFFLES